MDEVETNEAAAKEDRKGHSAMRAFLGRAEVRLSTMHRIGGNFLSGAGLLLIFSLFFKDAFATNFSFIITAFSEATSSIGNENLLFSIFRYISPSISALLFLALIFIPLYAIYHLLRDITLFYFTPYAPGFSETKTYPRFTLSALAFSPDESEVAKEEIYKIQYEKIDDFFNFIIPYSDSKMEYYIGLYDSTGGKIAPKTRKEGTKPWEFIQEHDRDKAKAVSTALGLSGLLDRRLVEEVAKMEISIVRHGLRLRRLVLRYIKAMIICIITAISVYILSIAIGDSKIVQSLNTDGKLVFSGIVGDSKAVMHIGAIGRSLCVYFVYFAWAACTLHFVRMPIKWIHEIGDPRKDIKRQDQHLQHFEMYVRRVCCFSMVLAGLAFVFTLIVGYVK